MVTKLFSIDKSLNGVISYKNNFLKIYSRKAIISKNDLKQTTRIGITKAKNLKWRWYMKDSRSISKREKGDIQPKISNKN